MAKPFTVRIRVGRWGNGSPEPAEEIEVPVDTGASYTALPKSLLKRMGVPVLGRMTLRLANGEKIEREYGPCLLKVMEGWYGTTVLMAEGTDIPLLGTSTMNDASVEVDLRTKQLVPVQA